MPRIKGAMKALRQSERRHERNRSIVSALRTYVKKARTTIESKAADAAPDALKLAASQLDKAASKGVIHRNQAARRKSRLMKLWAATSAIASAEAVEETKPAASRARSTTRAAAGTARGGRATATPRARSTAAAEKKAPATRARRAPAKAEDKPAAAPKTTRARRTTKE